MNRFLKDLRHLCIFIFLLIVGCASYGSIIPDNEANQEFETYQLRSNYNYYTIGTEIYPAIIIGLDKSYTLESELWKKRELTPEVFRQLVNTMREVMRFKPYQPKGFKMLDDKGNVVGVWYSLVKARTGFSVDGNIIKIISPNPSVYQEMSGLDQ